MNFLRPAGGDAAGITCRVRPGSQQHGAALNPHVALLAVIGTGSFGNATGGPNLTRGNTSTWVNAQRVLRAQILLEESQLSIDEVASEAGFGQAVLLRHHFHRALGTSPAAYRRTFRGTAASASAAQMA